jgi:hypothetical protein
MSEQGGFRMPYRTDKKTVVEMERLFEVYERDVEERRKDSCLEQPTVNTYLSHARDFIRWCKGEFIPGARKLQKKTKPY